MKIDKKKPLLSMAPAEMEAAFDEAGMGINVAILNEARNGGSPCRIACATLRSPNLEGGVIALRALEDGDGEGVRYIEEFIAEVERVGLLLPGETLKANLCQVTAAEEIKL